jgi:hypothetical protein
MGVRRWSGSPGAWTGSDEPAALRARRGGAGAYFRASSTGIDSRFPSVLAPPGPSEQRELIRVMARDGRARGAIYDALVGLTAKLHGAALVTADRRAAQTYELIGVEVRWLDLTPPAP